jgi:prepilin-type processing-associated H-X9-DG protein
MTTTAAPHGSTSRRPSRGPACRRLFNLRRGITALDILVVVSVIGALVALLLPAVSTARETGRRMTCRNNLKQILIAMHNYHDVFSTFPAGWMAVDSEATTGPFYGWQTVLLPFLEEMNLYDEIDFGQPLFSARQGGKLTSGTLRTTKLKALRCPSDVTPDVNSFRSDWATSNYSGNFGSLPLPRLVPDRMGQWWPGAAATLEKSDGILYWNSYVGMAFIIDGTSNTLMCGERSITSGAGIWIGVIQNQFENDQVTDCSHRSRLNGSYGSFSSLHPGGANFAFADGAVRVISQTIDSRDAADKLQAGAYQKLASRDGGETVDFP